MANDRSPAEVGNDFAAIARTAAAGGWSAASGTTWLHIGDEHLVVLSGRGGEPETERRLDLGAARIARDFFRHDPPTAGEIESAIDFAEDEIMRLGKPSEPAAQLFGAGPGLRAWAAVSGPTMPIEAVEQWFQRLAAAALGQPGAMQGLPGGREAAATLVILREFMHHLGHPAIAVAAAVRAPD